MIPHANPIRSYRRYWLPELIVLIALAAGTTILFAVTNLDVETIRPYYRPGLENPWPLSKEPLWSLFYRSAPWVTASLAVAGTLLLVFGLTKSDSRQFRIYGLFMLLCVAIGPGLIINVVLKDHWGRPRPRQIEEFGGRLTYTQPLVPSNRYGKSFPCGHCSVGYLYGVGWWLWRRKHPGRAVASLAAGLTLGTLLGIGRMTAGAHFLSDAFWSALIAFFIAHLLYYYVLRIPAREDGLPSLYPQIETRPRLKRSLIAAAVLLGLGIVGGGMLASPTDADLTRSIDLTAYPVRPGAVEIRAKALDLELALVDQPVREIAVSGWAHGFGLWTNKIRSSWDVEPGQVPTFHFRVIEHGLFTDIDGNARIAIPVSGMKRITVRLGRGDIVVRDERGASKREALPALDLATGDGEIQRP
ncbi:MAG: phosphatase PAP2 family protein [Nitrospiraceae bacterium]|nr:phosphatase PAP2 family protein [Nitrospiraceae bacterium]